MIKILADRFWVSCPSALKVMLILFAAVWLLAVVAAPFIYDNSSKRDIQNQPSGFHCK
jgi:hypothetical protein